MANENEINYKEYYEAAGKSSDIWNWQGRKFEYYREISRYRRLANIIGKTPLNVLDLGCGDGFLSCMLANEGHNVDAMDVSSERLAKFKEKATQLGIIQINDSVFDYTYSKSYDIVVMSEVIEHLDDYMSVLKKVVSILKPSGRLLIAVPYRERLSFCKCPYCLKEFNSYGHIHSFSEQVFETLAKDLGFSIHKISTMNNKLSAYLSKFGPTKTYMLYKLSDIFFSAVNKKMDTHMIVEMIKK